MLKFNTDCGLQASKCDISHPLTERGGCTFGSTDDSVSTEISWIHR